MVVFVENFDDFVGHFIWIRLVPFAVNLLAILFVHVRHSVLADVFVLINTGTWRPPNEINEQTNETFWFDLLEPTVNQWNSKLLPTAWCMTNSTVSICIFSTQQIYDCIESDLPILQLRIQNGAMEFQILFAPVIKQTRERENMKFISIYCCTSTHLAAAAAGGKWSNGTSIYSDSLGCHLTKRLIRYVTSIVAPLPFVLLPIENAADPEFGAWTIRLQHKFA